jgi:aspartyl-tRNA(Asn)/glutamyl-tRNA(Gln) amidotransferase subunit C
MNSQRLILDLLIPRSLVLRVERPPTLCYSRDMAISRDEVRRVALLARLSITDEEEQALADQLGHILEHFERLSELDTENVEPTAHVTATDTLFRDDVVRNQPATEQLLANAPGRDGRFFKVPKII